NVFIAVNEEVSSLIQQYIIREIKKVLDKYKGVATEEIRGVEKLINSISNEELKEEFLNDWSMSVKIAKSLKEEKKQLLVTFPDDVNEEIPYDFIKSILENFGKVLKESTGIEEQKKLLHMIISEITMNKLREIDSIKIKIDDCLVDYLNNEEGVSLKGTPSSFILKNIGVNILNLNICL
ncbi:MAG: recombinase family protein, partial [Inconstantimicrobium porci]|nr:recombinase family protein [Inconstantimicrobium porci]